MYHMNVTGEQHSLDFNVIVYDAKRRSRCIQYRELLPLKGPDGVPTLVRGGGWKQGPFQSTSNANGIRIGMCVPVPRLETVEVMRSASVGLPLDTSPRRCFHATAMLNI